MHVEEDFASTVVEYVPFPHGVQLDAPANDHVPALHCVQDEDPAPEYFPAGH